MSPVDHSLIYPKRSPTGPRHFRDNGDRNGGLMIRMSFLHFQKEDA